MRQLEDQADPTATVSAASTPCQPQRRAAVRRADPLLVILGLLTLVTGLVDAACYLGLGRVFTANMTGNVVLLAFGAAGTQGLPVLGPTVSLMVFLVGAAGGGRLATRLVGPANSPVSASARQRWLGITLLIELGLVITAGMAGIGLPLDGGGGRRYLVIALAVVVLRLGRSQQTHRTVRMESRQSAGA
jgi:hypothetical protein